MIYLPISLVCGVIGVGKLLELLRGFKDYLLVITLSSFAGTVAFAAMSPVVWHALGAMSGIPALGSFIAYLSIFGFAALHHILVLMWGRDNGAIAVSRLSGRIRTLGFFYALNAVGMTVFFFHASTGPASPSPWSFDVECADIPGILAFLCLYACGCLFAQWDSARECWKCADFLVTNASPSVETVRGLRWLSIGNMFIGLSFVPKAVGFLAAAAGHHELDILDTASPLIGSFGALFNQVGYLGTVFGTWARERSDLRALRPLWDLVVPENADHLAQPGAALFGVRFHLFRRVIEILDALVNLRPWMVPETAERVRAAARKQGLSEEESDATATAAMVLDAVSRKQRNESPRQTPLVQLLPPVEPTRERERLVRVARALHAPVVRLATAAAQAPGNGFHTVGRSRLPGSNGPA
ncbi:MAB_1171c family putative transporter [Streptomyces luteireticuli]|uniref:MAB_1171c family putative transporter n=1 Tax=Streptomyces luteireticuli TaxID=173858 RepID=UPI003557E603